MLLVVASADEGKETSAQVVGFGYAALTYFGAEVRQEDPEDSHPWLDVERMSPDAIPTL